MPALDRLVALGRFLEIQNLGLNLPFALGFLWIATAGAPGLRTTALIVIAFVAARNAGHAFNRWTDRDLDARNPRTADRLLVRSPGAGRLALAFAAANAAVLALSAWLLNPIALLLVPVALAIVLGYSLTKRYSSLTTLFLGLVEAITPAAVYLGATGTYPPAAIVATAGIFAWGTAFETIHSLGDLASDAALGLRSLPLAVGRPAALGLLYGAHAAALVALAAVGAIAHLGIGYYVAIGAMGVGAGLVDRAVTRGPEATRAAFRAHFALAGIFLAGSLLGFIA